MASARRRVWASVLAVTNMLPMPRRSSDLISGIDSIARTDQANIHQHHVGMLSLGDADRLISGDSDGDDDVAEGLQQPSGMQRNVELILDDQDAQRPRLHFRLIAMLRRSSTSLRSGRGQPKMHWCQSEFAKRSCRCCGA